MAAKKTQEGARGRAGTEAGRGIGARKTAAAPKHKAVRGSRTGRPVMALLDLLGRRWALRILWELRDEGPITFRALQAACEGVSPSVLNHRLRELRDAGLVEQREGQGYVQTRRASELGELLLPLDAWAKKWAKGSGGR